MRLSEAWSEQTNEWDHVNEVLDMLFINAQAFINPHLFSSHRERGKGSGTRCQDRGSSSIVGTFWMVST